MARAGEVVSGSAGGDTAGTWAVDALQDLGAQVHYTDAAAATNWIETAVDERRSACGQSAGPGRGVPRPVFERAVPANP
jgi:hypothetical protein